MDTICRRRTGRAQHSGCDNRMRPFSVSFVHRETGAAWDETAANYEGDEAEQIALLQAGGTTLLEPEQTVLGDLSWCNRAVHLQCAGGSDTLSLLKQGAKTVVGLDISPRMIAIARRKTMALDAPATWHCADVLDAPPELDGSANLVYTGRGALPWVADINAWARVAARLLAPEGKLFVFEGHPLDWVWNENAADYERDKARGDYFSDAASDTRWPMPFLDGLVRPAGAPRAREHQWKLGDILNALVSSGLLLEHFAEYPAPYWDLFPQMPVEVVRRLPHTFSLLMRRP